MSDRHSAWNLLMLVSLPLMFVSAQAEESDGAALFFSNLQWYGSLSTSYLDVGGNIQFYGTTASAYGGTPAISMDDGSKFSVAIGAELSDGWRLEGELSYLSSYSNTNSVFGTGDRVDDTFAVDAKIESLLLMLNGSYDLDVGSSRFTPYLKGGVGVTRNTTSQAILNVEYNSAIWNGSVLQGQSITDYRFPEGYATEFAWSASAGFRMKVSERFALSLEYGYLDLGEALTETNAGGDALGLDNFSAQKLSIGVNYRF